MDFDIVDFMYTELEEVCGDIPVREGWYNEDINGTHVTFFLIMDEDGEYANDDNYSEEYYIQVDIWSKSSKESRALKKSVKKHLKNLEFCYEDGADLFENDTKIFHKALRFNYTKYI